MKNDKALREHLLYLLKDGGAHLDFDAAVKDLAPAVQGQRPPGSAAFTVGGPGTHAYSAVGHSGVHPRS